MSGSVVVIGGSSGLGKAVAAHYAAQGREVVVTSRDEARAEVRALHLALGVYRPWMLAAALRPGADPLPAEYHWSIEEIARRHAADRRRERERDAHAAEPTDQPRPGPAGPA